MRTVRPLLRTTKGNSKGLYPISVCVTEGGKRNYHATGIAVVESAWDANKEKVKASVANAAAFNTKIAGLVAQLQSGEYKGKGEAVDFYAYAEVIFKEMESRGKKVTAQRYRNNMPSIRAYSGDKLLLSQMDREWLKGYEQFCRGVYKNPRVKKERPIANNTVWSRFKMLRKILLYAQEEGKDIACHIGKKRGGYPMPPYEQKPKDYLTLDELDRLTGLLGHAGFTPFEDRVLSFFLVECTAGIRHSDWSRFSIERVTDSDALKVRTLKTGEPVYVPIIEGTRLARTLAHIKEREYVYTDKESASANRALKIIAKVAGISKPITSHTGRHTCATLFLEKGFSREAVADVLGISMQVVDTYAKMTRLKVRNEFAKYGGL